MSIHSLSFLMVVDDGVNGFFKVSRLFLGPEQLDSYSSSKRIEIFIEEEFLHLLVDDGEFILKDSSQNELIFLVFDIVLPFIQNFVETGFKKAIYLLGSHRKDFHCTADNG